MDRQTAIVEFLQARLDEDEQTARRIKATRHGALVVAPGDGESPSVFEVRSDRLAEVEAKRQIIEHNARLHQMADPATHPGQEYVLAAGASDYVLRLLALPYANHKDYREEWKS